MKKIALFLSLSFAFIFPQSFISQTQDRVESESGWIFLDAYGNELLLENINTNAKSKILGTGTNSVNASGYVCTAGYFNLYFEAGSFFDVTPGVQTVMCELFSNLSGLIYSTLPSNSVTANIYLGNYSGTVTPAPLAVGTAVYAFPKAQMPNITNSGIVESQVYKAIKTGSDPFDNFPASLFVDFLPNTAFYHGYILINPTYQWYVGLGTSTVSTEYDLYSVILHEATHMLGFASMMRYDGNSVWFDKNINNYGSYDKFLVNSAGVPLLSSNTPSSCPYSNSTFTLSASNIQPGGCPSAITNSTNCSTAVQYSSASTGTIPVYTPDCFQQGSSLSHFEDLCYAPNFTAATTCFTAASNTNNDLYWVMSNANGTGPCFVKRYLKPLERLVLCDLGYNVNTTYTSNATGAAFNYSGSACAGKDIWGVDDGFNGSIFTITTTATSISIPTTQIAANDASTTVQLTCLDVIYNNATASISGGSLVVTATTGYHGLVLIKYLPENSSGEQGNPTFVYVYFVPIGCAPSGVCNLVQNGNFESVVYGPACNNVISGPGNLPAQGLSSLPGCWEAYQGAPDIFSRNCTNTLAPNYDLGINTLGSAIDSYNGSPNNHVVGLSMAFTGMLTAPGYMLVPRSSDVLKNNLSSPLMPSQNYQVSFLASNISANISNPNSQPIIITVASAPVFNMPSTGTFPTGLNILAQFTISATSLTASPWTAFTQAFTFTPTVPHSALIIGGDALLTFPSTNTTNISYCFLDEVSIQSLSTPTFAIPNALACGNVSFTNLAQYATGSGTFTGANTSYTSPQFDFNLSGTLVAGYYPLAYSSSNGMCINTVWENVFISPPPVMLAPPLTTLSCINSSPTLAVSVINSPGTTYTFNPGNLLGSAHTITPTSNATYTFSATEPQFNCISTATFAVSSQTDCCGSSIMPVAQISPTTTLLQGSMLIASDFTVSSALSMQTGQYWFKPDVQVTIASGGWIDLSDVHLLACDNNMWNGIEILDGGLLTTNPSGGHNLIEDAKTAVSVYSNTSITSTSIFSITNTTFNKNYIDIDINYYPWSSGTFSNVFSVNNCVFTCRDFTFTQSSWPSPSSSTGLRAAPSGTTGISSPYPLLSAPITSLLPPHQTVTSNTAIRLINVGTTTGTAMYGIQIGGGSASDFNLFDAHCTYISAENSNVSLRNNVFQNTQQFLTPKSPAFPWILKITGGNAVQHSNYMMNSNLDLSAANVDVGNRFWNCHTAVYTSDLLRFKMENAIIRSSQSTASLTGQPGGSGLVMPTNRFQYFINDNEFTNIHSPINIPIAAGFYTTISTGTQTGIYADKILITYNNFSAGTPTTNYINTAVNITAPNNFPYTIANDYNITPFTKAIVVEHNNLTDVFRGINVNGITGIQTKIYSNNISLRQDNFFSSTQRAIELSNTMGTGNVAGQHIVSNNVVTGTGTINPTESLVYSSINTGLFSPSVTCNELDDSYNGFVFNSTNTLAVWAGNVMQPLAQGLVLSGNGRIGAQGTASIASNNEWQSSWSGNHTYVDAVSDASASVLFVKNGATTTPSNNSGPSPAQNFGAPGTLSLSIGGDYQCGGEPNSIVIGPPNESDYNTAGYFYIAKTAAFRFLHFNEEVIEAGGDLSTFYNALEGSSVDKFMQVEENLYQGNISEASSLLAEIETDASIVPEENYKLFYGLYLNYLNLNQDSIYSVEDSTSLISLALQCPSTDGASIFQARALYNRIYPGLVSYYGCDEVMSSRAAKINDNIDNSIKTNGLWTVELFPNPAQNEVYLVSKKDNEILNFIITDISGRVVLTKTIEAKGTITLIELELINGLYFITIINDNHERFTKKLLIAR